MFGLGTLIGAAAGGLGSLFGGGGKQTSSTMPDAQTQQIRDAIFQQAQGLLGSDAYKGILGGYSGYSNLSNLGARALGGDQGAFGAFMNPYLENVLKRSNAQFDQLSKDALGNVNDAATKAGAFGGSRAAVANGVAQSQLANDRANMNANLLYGGFNDAQSRALAASQLGLQGNQAYMGALGFPTSIFAQALPGGGSTTTSKTGGGGVGGFISGALGGGILGNNLFGGGASPASSGSYVTDRNWAHF